MTVRLKYAVTRVYDRRKSKPEDSPTPRPLYIPRSCFFTPAGKQISNYPKQHSANLTAKHQATYEWFKPMVRILKNMRSRLMDYGILVAGSAPSYSIEGLLYNVPNDKFGKSYGDSFATLSSMKLWNEWN